MKYEYMLMFWGGCENDGWIWAQMPELNGSRYQWFDSAEAREELTQRLRETAGDRGLMTTFIEGEHTRIRSVAVCTFVMPDGTRYPITEDFAFGMNNNTLHDKASFIHFEYEENNRSCDHRRQHMIEERYPDYVSNDRFDSCDETIKLENLHVVLASEFITKEEQAQLLEEEGLYVHMLPADVPSKDYCEPIDLSKGSCCAGGLCCASLPPNAYGKHLSLTRH